MTAAASWENAEYCLPAEISSLLDEASVPSLANMELLAAIPEWQVSLPGGATNSATDILALCRNKLGLCVIAVEAKVLEDFGPPVADKRHFATPGQLERLDFLHRLLKVDHFADDVRYQLLHRTASALLTARQFHATTAVMLVHAFATPADRVVDFLTFASTLGAEQIAPGVWHIPSFSEPALYLAWCKGNESHRETLLQTALRYRTNG